MVQAMLNTMPKRPVTAVRRPGSPTARRTSSDLAAGRVGPWPDASYQPVPASPNRRAPYKLRRFSMRENRLDTRHAPTDRAPQLRGGRRHPQSGGIVAAPPHQEVAAQQARGTRPLHRRGPTTRRGSLPRGAVHNEIDCARRRRRPRAAPIPTSDSPLCIRTRVLTPPPRRSLSRPACRPRQRAPQTLLRMKSAHGCTPRHSETTLGKHPWVYALTLIQGLLPWIHATQ